MPSEVMPDITLRRVTPGSGKGALGKWRAPYRKHCLDSETGSSEHLNGCQAGGITMQPRDACRRVLKPRTVWEGPLGISCCCQPDSGGAAVKAAIQRVQVPPCQLPRYGHVAMPHPGAGNQPGNAWCKGPSRPFAGSVSANAVGAIRRSGKRGSLNRRE